MQLTDWIPAITTTGLLSLVLWLSRALITARLTRSVQHEFDEKLERLRSEFRAAEKSLEATLEQRSSELESLRAGALSGNTHRRALLDKRRLEAIDQLWGTLIANQGARGLAMTMSVMKLEGIAERVSTDSHLRDFIKSLAGRFDPSKADNASADLARPYVSDLAWALYSAIQAITGYYVAHWVALSHGIDSRKMVASETVESLILAAAPDCKEYLRKYGLAASYHLLEHLDVLLLAELNRMATDFQQDKESVRQAAEILEHARGLNEMVSSGPWANSSSRPASLGGAA